MNKTFPSASRRIRKGSERRTDRKTTKAEVRSNSLSWPPMGPLEKKVHETSLQALHRYRRRVEEDLVLRKLRQELAAKNAGSEVGQDRITAAAKTGFGSIRSTAVYHTDEDEDSVQASPARGDAAIPPADIAARLMLARALDERRELSASLQASAPVIIIETSTDMAATMARAIGTTLFDDERVGFVSSRIRAREDLDCVCMLAKDPPKARDKPALEKSALAALAMALPFIFVSPSPVSNYLPNAVRKASGTTIGLSKFDPLTIQRVIHIVTGGHCDEMLDHASANSIGFDDLTIAVRFDRTPSECMTELKRLVAHRQPTNSGRDISLDDLHGMPEAVAWARSTIADLEAWRNGTLDWSAVASSVALTGPPGTGKTLLAQAFASAAKASLHVGNMAKWQAAGDGHLGSLLQSMRADFQACRENIPSVLLIDECDSFPNRSKVEHSHKDYVVTVVNSLLELLDGVAGREGVIVIGTSNDLSRCDPALLRSGRLSRVVNIGLPDPDELVKMLRMRLGTDLTDVDLKLMGEIAVGMTGADIEQAVNDARRMARHARRDLTIEDIRHAIGGAEDRPEQLRSRTCFHEAGHILVDVVHNGPDNVFATTTRRKDRGGVSIRMRSHLTAGTHADYRKMIEILLAGRTAEELVFAEASHGAGGVDGSDLELATSLAAAMAGSLGLIGPAPLVYLGPASQARDFLHQKDIRKVVDAELRKAAVSCRDILLRYRTALERIADRLSQTGRIDGMEVSAIIGQSNLNPPSEGAHTICENA